MGRKERSRRSKWNDQECEEATRRRNSKSKCYIERPTRAKRVEYETAIREAHRIMKKKKRSYMNSMMLAAEQNFGENNYRVISSRKNMLLIRQCTGRATVRC